LVLLFVGRMLAISRIITLAVRVVVSLAVCMDGTLALVGLL
jgi:hypothetical protein